MYMGCVILFLINFICLDIYWICNAQPTISSPAFLETCSQICPFQDEIDKSLQSFNDRLQRQERLIQRKGEGMQDDIIKLEESFTSKAEKWQSEKEKTNAQLADIQENLSQLSAVIEHYNVSMEHIIHVEGSIISSLTNDENTIEQMNATVGGILRAVHSSDHNFHQQNKSLNKIFQALHGAERDLQALSNGLRDLTQGQFNLESKAQMMNRTCSAELVVLNRGLVQVNYSMMTIQEQFQATIISLGNITSNMSAFQSQIKQHEDMLNKQKQEDQNMVSEINTLKVHQNVLQITTNDLRNGSNYQNTLIQQIREHVSFLEGNISNISPMNQEKQSDLLVKLNNTLINLNYSLLDAKEEALRVEVKIAELSSNLSQFESVQVNLSLILNQQQHTLQQLQQRINQIQSNSSFLQKMYEEDITHLISDVIILKGKNNNLLALHNGTKGAIKAINQTVANSLQEVVLNQSQENQHLRAELEELHNVNCLMTMLMTKGGTLSPYPDALGFLQTTANSSNCRPFLCNFGNINLDLKLQLKFCGFPASCHQMELGMESGAIPDENLIGSSVFSDHFLSKNGRLNHAYGWYTEKLSLAGWTPGSQWLQVILGDLYLVTAVATQGGTYGSWVEMYTLDFSLDGNQWMTYGPDGNTTFFSGNHDKDTIEKNQIDPPIRARHLRLMVQSFQGAYIALRMEIYGCRL